MNIMIDYDNTYTADVDMWRKVLPIFQLAGHRVYLVTSRGMDTPIDLVNDFINLDITVVYCEYRAKKDVCLEQGIDISIWIDDDPYYITTGFITDDVPLTLLKITEKDFQVKV